MDNTSDVKVKAFNLQKIESSLHRRIRTFKCLKSEIKEGMYDVIIVVDTYKSLCFVPIMPLLKKKGIKFITWEHFNYNFGGKYSPRWWERKVATKISDAVVVLSKADYAAWKGNMKHSDILKQIYNFSCFEMEKPKFDADCKTVLAVGRLENQKGFDYLLDIWKRIEDDTDLNDWKLQIVGSGSLKEELYYKEKKLRLERVQWMPFTEHIEELYKKASVYAMSSRFEGFAQVLIEAKAFGLPIVSFDIKNGPKEIVQQGKDGFLIPAYNVSLFAEKLKLIMKDNHLREQFTESSQSNMSQFTKDKITSQWLELFEEITA